MYKTRAVPHEDSWEPAPSAYPNPILGYRQAMRFVMETTIRLLRMLIFLLLCLLTGSISQAGRSSFRGGAVVRQMTVNSIAADSTGQHVVIGFHGGPHPRTQVQLASHSAFLMSSRTELHQRDPEIRA